MLNQKFTLRAIRPSDGPAIINLNTEFDDDLTTRFLLDPYVAITEGTEFRTQGVVVEATGYEEIVGMGTVRFSRVQFNGQVLPLAFLDNLKVREEFRGQGLGYQIASWRIQQAREILGNDCVIGTGMLQENLASRAVAKKWCREVIGPLNAFIVPVRSRVPKSPKGITVHEIESREYEEFAAKQNMFYKDHNFYMQGDANSITRSLSIVPGGKKLYRIYAVVDSSGNLLAGAHVWFRGLIKSDTINNPPAALRILNHALHLFPADLVIRDAAVTGLWHAPDQLQAAEYLWEMIRYLSKDEATNIATGFDPRDPIQAAIKLKPWHQPRPKIMIAIHGPTPIDRDKLIFSYGRV
jgi:Predicted acetyltransferase